MAQYLSSNVNKVTTNTLQRMRNEGELIAMMTAYDYSIAKLLDIAKSNCVAINLSECLSNALSHCACANNANLHVCFLLK